MPYSAMQFHSLQGALPSIYCSSLILSLIVLCVTSMEGAAITHAEACLQRKFTSPDFEMETPPRALIAFMLISTLSPRESSCATKTISEIPLTLLMHISPLSRHFNILLFPCPAHLSVYNSPRKPESTSAIPLFTHIHLY